jgi:hypothetical protein
MHFSLHSFAAAVAIIAAANAAPHGERQDANNGPGGFAHPTGTYGQGRGGPGNAPAFPTGFPTNGGPPSGDFGGGAKGGAGAGLNGPDAPAGNSEPFDSLAALASQIGEWFKPGGKHGGLGAAPTGGFGFSGGVSGGLFPSGGAAFPTGGFGGGFGFPGGNKQPPGEKPTGVFPPAGGAAPTGIFGLLPGGGEQPSSNAPSSAAPPAGAYPTNGFGFAPGGDEQPSRDKPSAVVPPAGNASPTSKAYTAAPAPTEPAALPSGGGVGDINTVSFVFPSTTAGGFGGF